MIKKITAIAICSMMLVGTSGYTSINTYAEECDDEAYEAEEYYTDGINSDDQNDYEMADLDGGLVKASGKVLKQKYVFSNGFAEIYDYDIKGKLNRFTAYYAGNGRIKEVFDIYYEYDNLERIVKWGFKYLYTLDKDGNIIQERMDPDWYDNEYYTFEYLSNGNKIANEYKGNILLASEEYDKNDVLLKKTYYEDGEITYTHFYEYNVDNSIKKETIYYLNNPYCYSTFDYEYDSLGRIIKRKEECSNDEFYTEDDIYEYNSDGDLIKVIDARDEWFYTAYEYYDNPSTGTLATTGIYCASNYPSIQAGINIQKSNPSDVVEYRWVGCNNNNPEHWFEVSPWTRNNNWMNWTPKESGGYVFVCYARIVGQPETEIQFAFGTEYHKQIKGICQMPYTGEGGGYLIGIESYDNPNHAYQYEMLILDCNLYMQGKDAWVYTTGRCGAEGNCLWTVWQPQYGYYWTLFRIYDADGNLIDEACYGFENVN